jgi:putative tryptophan/tyrosine transport system substrate-binding protein
MRARIFVYALSALILTTIHLAEAQQQKVYQVGAIMVGETPLVKGFREGLREAGYIEGKNLVLDIAVKQHYDELRPLVKAYTEKKVAVIATFGGTAALIAKELAPEIPIVFVGVADPITTGVVKSLARPEGNVTGVAGRTDLELQGKRLEIFKEAVPTLRRLVLLYNARGENPLHMKSLELIQRTAPNFGLKLNEKPIKSVADVEEVLSSAYRDSTDGVFVICSTLFRDLFRKMAAIALQKRLPLAGCSAYHVTEQGALLSYAADLNRIGHRAAWYVDRILKGTKPRELPVENPNYFELVINIKTAKQIGLTIPPNVLARADRVIR